MPDKNVDELKKKVLELCDTIDKQNDLIKKYQKALMIAADELNESIDMDCYNRCPIAETMKSECELVRKGEVKRRGNTADRAISSSGKVIYTCYGYTDAMTDEPLDECKRCKHWEKNDSLYKALFEDGE